MERNNTQKFFAFNNDFILQIERAHQTPGRVNGKKDTYPDNISEFH